MKKLNRKGFTLVELLAVIIILAIVVGISIPAITNVINDSKNNSLGVAVDAAEKFISDQYALVQIDTNSVQDVFYNWLFAYKTSGAGGENHTIPLYTASTNSITHTMSKTKLPNLIKAMGFNIEDVETVYVSIDGDDGSVCVQVNKIPVTSKYYSVEYWYDDPATTAKTATPVGTSTQYKSKGCA